MIFKDLHLVTKLEVWYPRYHDLYSDGERVALLAKYKVDSGSAWIIVNFTKAKHLAGQRYCIQREKAKTYPIDTNGKIDCYAVPMSALEPWDTADEVIKTALSVFDG